MIYIYKYKSNFIVCNFILLLFTRTINERYYRKEKFFRAEKELTLITVQWDS